MKIIPEMNYDWDSQAIQYAATGKPGVHLETHTIGNGDSETEVDCLLYRDDDGQLIGILNHYNENNKLQKPDTGNLWVKPNCQHSGVATELLRAAANQWPDKVTEWFENQTFTTAGIAWIQSLVDKGVLNQEKSAFIDKE